MPKDPKPRVCHFYGTVLEATVHDDGTWIEDESFAYPNDTYTRRARVWMADGTLRVVYCKCADTWFSIPALARVGRNTVRGYVTQSDDKLVFIPYENQNARP